MLTITFSQCAYIEQDSFSAISALHPMLERCNMYERVLSSGEGAYTTLDENMILVALYLRRTGVIKELTLVSVCGCNGHHELLIETDDEGELVAHPHHGLFQQRIKYLFS